MITIPEYLIIDETILAGRLLRDGKPGHKMIRVGEVTELSIKVSTGGGAVSTFNYCSLMKQVSNNFTYYSLVTLLKVTAENLYLLILFYNFNFHFL